MIRWAPANWLCGQLGREGLVGRRGMHLQRLLRRRAEQGKGVPSAVDVSDGAGEG